jgi:hypothetical protein
LSVVFPINKQDNKFRVVMHRLQRRIGFKEADKNSYKKLYLTNHTLCCFSRRKLNKSLLLPLHPYPSILKERQPLRG